MPKVFLFRRSHSRHAAAAGRFTAAGESGIALIEFVLTAPFLILFITGMWDLGRALNEYLTVSRIVYEGTRYAASVPGLEAPTAVSSGVTEGSTYGIASLIVPANVSTHQRVRDRISMLIARYGIPASDATISTRVYKDASGTVADNQVTVRVTFRFQCFFPLLDQLITRIGAESTGPYMFAR